MAAPTGAVALYGTRRPLGAMLRSVRLPLTKAAAKPLAMLRWVRPDQIVMLKLLRESRNKSCKNAAIFVFTMGGLPQRADIAMGRVRRSFLIRLYFVFVSKMSRLCDDARLIDVEQLQLLPKGRI